MDNFTNIVLHVIIVYSLVFISATRPSSKLFAQKHPFITLIWVATALTVAIMIIIRHRSTLDATGISLLVGFLVMSGAVLVKIEQKWNTKDRITSLLLGISIISFISMIAISMLL